MLALIIVVQQIESNVLEPFIMSKVIALHPLVVVLAVAAGALAYGVLGAFLAVPLWAAAARVVDHLRGRRPPAGPASEDMTEDVGEDAAGEDREGEPETGRSR